MLLATARRVSSRPCVQGKIISVFRALLVRRFVLQSVDAALMSADLLVGRRCQRRTIDSFDDEAIPNNFRFKSKAQLRTLFQGFRFPEVFQTMQREKYGGEVVFLVGLQRLASSTRTTDSFWLREYGRCNQDVSKMFHLFTAGQFGVLEATSRSEF